MKPGERGGSIYDGLALYLRNPEIWDDYCLGFPGSRAYSDRVPIIYRDTEKDLTLDILPVEARNTNMKIAWVVAGRSIDVKS